MSGSLQSHDYVPGRSGLKIDLKTGEFELNSYTLGSAANAPERQFVSVEVASWSKYDLPKNAANLLQFMQAELERVPEQYRNAAEFEEYDASYGDESYSARLFLSYSRLETEEELADRLEKAKNAGTRINLAGGVLSISHDGALRAQIGDLQKDENPAPSIIVDGVTYINEACIKDASVEDKVAAQGTVRTVLLGDKHFMSGLGLGMCTGGYTGDGPEPGASLKASGFAATLDRFAIQIDETDLGKGLKEQISSVDADQVNKRIDELKEKQGAENRAVAARLETLAASVAALEQRRDFRRPI